jgi:hypothetical protein
MKMQETLEQFQHYIKRGLAMVLFMVLLVGASAAALAAFAASVTALSGLNHRDFVSPSVAAAQTSPLSGASHSQSAPSSAKPLPTPPQPTSNMPARHETFVNQLNQKLDHMHSPVGESLDSGGVVLGQQVERGFGNLMSGLLQTLFFERPDQAAGSSRNPS